MKISVITAAYNSEKSVRKSLDSFFEQTWPEKEMIFFDGASSDRTLEIAREYETENLRIFSEPDNGMYDAVNKGLKFVSGDAFGVMNSDDCFHSKFSMSKIAEALTTHHMVHGHVNYVENHSSKRLIRSWKAEPRPIRGFKSGWMPCHTSFFVRKEVVDSVGEFDLNYSISADYDWMIRAIDFNNFRLKTIDEVLIDMKVGGMSTKNIRSHLIHNIQALKVRQKLFGTGIVDYALFGKPLRKLKQFFDH